MKSESGKFETFNDRSSLLHILKGLLKSEKLVPTWKSVFPSQKILQIGAGHAAAQHLLQFFHIS